MYKYILFFISILMFLLATKKYRDYYRDDEVELPNEYIVY